MSPRAPLRVTLCALAACTTTAPPPSGGAGEAAGGEPAPRVDVWAGVPPIAAEVEAPPVRAPAAQRPVTIAERISEPFPAPGPAAPPVSAAGGPLKVLRTAPTDKASGLVGSVSAVFDRPMVPLAALADLEAEGSPLTLSPAAPGRFRWLGTQMIAFEAEGRLPGSTTYTAKIAAGATAATGEVLARDLTWTFKTPTLEVESQRPGSWEDAPLDTLVLLRFNQAIDRARVVAALRLSAGGRAVPFEAVAPESWASLREPWRGYAAEGPSDRQVVLRPAGPLAPNTGYSVELPPGAYGEGPNPSPMIRARFKTFAALKLRGPDCAPPYYWECFPEEVTIQAENLLAEDPDIARKVRVTPEVPDLEVTLDGSITLSGSFRGLTAYTVEVPAGIRDVFGQTLAAPYRRTFTFPPLRPQLGWQDNGERPVVLTPGQSLELKAQGVAAVEVMAVPVGVEQLSRYARRPVLSDEGEFADGFGAPSWRRTFATPAARREPALLQLDPAALGVGASLVYVGARSNRYREWGEMTRVITSRLVQQTRLGLTAALDVARGVVLVHDIESGEPIPGVSLSLHQSGEAEPRWSGATDAAGTAQVECAETCGDFLVARRAGELAYLPLQLAADGRWRDRIEARSDEHEVFFYNERAPVRPGETVHVQGIARDRARGPAGSLRLWSLGSAASYTLRGPRGGEVAKGSVQLGPFGTFSVPVAIPAGTEVGQQIFELVVEGEGSPEDRTFRHPIEVQEFRKPEFEVKVERAAAAAPVFGDALEASIAARYFHGAPLVDADVQYSLQREEIEFRPPGEANEAFTFGRAVGPRWERRRKLFVLRGRGKTDAQGLVAVRHVLAPVEKRWSPQPRDTAPPEAPKGPIGAATYVLEAQVVDESRQAISGRASYVVHPASEYPGVRSDRRLYRAGERARIEAVVIDLEGTRIAGREVAVKLVRRERARVTALEGGERRTRIETTEVEAGGCAITSQAAPASCEIEAPKAGVYEVQATSVDPKGRAATSVLPLDVLGAGAVVPSEEPRRVDVVADRARYEPGEVATLLLRAPFERGQGILAVDHSGLMSHQVIAVEDGAATVELPITEDMIPGVRVAVVLDRGRTAAPDPAEPAYAVGELRVPVATTRKKIALEVAPERAEVAPKDALQVTLRARDHAGAAQEAVVAVMVVDEAVLSVLGFKTPDPLEFFHRRRPVEVSLHDLRRFLAVRRSREEDDPPTLFDEADVGEANLKFGLMMRGPSAGEGTLGLGNVGLIGKGSGSGYGRGAGAGFGGRGDFAPDGPRPRRMAKADPGGFARASELPVALRAAFSAAAYFNPEVRIDASGETKLEIPMPDDLTSYRIMAVAVDPTRPDRFGSADAAVKVRKSIMLRPSLPRFVHVGDRFEASVMVDNQTGEAQAIMVGARGRNVALAGEALAALEVPAGGSKEVRFPLATERAGTMRLQFAALSAGGRDATEVSLPVRAPATRQAFADYGVTSESVARPLALPKDALASYGGLELRLSSTALTGLQDAAEFLEGNEYDCSEQIVSRMLPMLVLGPLLEKMPIAGGQDLARREEQVRRGLARLKGRQNYDGGFRLWERRGPSSPYLSVWAALGMLEAKKAGLLGEEEGLKAALDYLARFVEVGETTPWGRFYDHTSRAFAVWLLSREGVGGHLFDAVYARRREMPLYARALLLSAAQRYGRAGPRAALLKELRGRVVEGARAAHFAERASEVDAEGLQVLMHSDAQTDAIALVALLEAAPEDPLLPKVMAGLMEDRAPGRGAWGSTHATAWALLAANRYFTAVEKDVPDFVARVWLDDRAAFERTFAGREVEVAEQTVPMAELLAAGPGEIVIGKEGAGRLYYRLGLRYAPADGAIAAESRGLEVHRNYEAIAGEGEAPAPGAVRRLPDGTWEIKAGSLVRVHLTLIAKDRARFVVVDDPLPGGLEGLNRRFINVRRDLGDDQGGEGEWRWRSRWRFEHTELRDDRMLLFAERLPAGVYTYSYVARATSIGEYALPPTHAEAMYKPEVFGHGASGKVRVVP